MSGGSGNGRTGRPRIMALAATLAGMALLAVACGGSSSPSSAGSSGFGNLQTVTNQALAYAKCMRSHGITNFPDPTVQDNSRFKGVGFNLPSGDANLPQFHSANKACVKQTHFGQVTQAQLQQAMNTMLKFAECMRSHGIPSFPDPTENSHNVGFDTTGIDQNSPQFKAAQKSCQSLLPNGGP